MARLFLKMTWFRGFLLLFCWAGLGIAWPSFNLRREHPLSLQDPDFPWAIANTSVYLCASAYCETNTYMNRTYRWAGEGFIPYEIIDMKQRRNIDVQGFMGYMPSQNTIYIVFRGSTSFFDWIGNLDTKLTVYPNCNYNKESLSLSSSSSDGQCYVHAGFYHDEQAIYNSTIKSILALQRTYPTASLVVTGHSLGAAMATLLALDLLPHWSPPLCGGATVRMVNFGSPRLGNDAFAEYASTALGKGDEQKKKIGMSVSVSAGDGKYRVTHNRDAVPHLPWSRRYEHIDGEWYEDNENNLKECEGYEDPTCADQWYWLSIEDHMWYLQQYLGCKAV